MAKTMTKTRTKTRTKQYLCDQHRSRVSSTERNRFNLLINDRLSICDVHSAENAVVDNPDLDYRDSI